jgi:hypothetical protein
LCGAAVEGRQPLPVVAWRLPLRGHSRQASERQAPVLTSPGAIADIAKSTPKHPGGQLLRRQSLNRTHVGDRGRSLGPHPQSSPEDEPSALKRYQQPPGRPAHSGEDAVCRRGCVPQAKNGRSCRSTGEQKLQPRETPAAFAGLAGAHAVARIGGGLSWRCSLGSPVLGSRFCLR